MAFTEFSEIVNFVWGHSADELFVLCCAMPWHMRSQLDEKMQEGHLSFDFNGWKLPAIISLTCV